MDFSAEGDVAAHVEFVNSYDESMCRMGLLPMEEVRSFRLTANVDRYGAVLSLPLQTIENLGLLGISAFHGEAELLSVPAQKLYGPVTVQCKGRSVFALAAVSPEGAPAMLGRRSLQALGLDGTCFNSDAPV